MRPRCWRSPAIPGTLEPRWASECAPYLGPATATSSPCPLRAGRRRSRSRPLPLDLLPPLLLPSHPGAQSCLSRQLCSRLKTAFHAGALQFHGHLLPLAEPRAFASWLRVLFRHDWVVLLQTAFRRARHVLRYLGAYTSRVARCFRPPAGCSSGTATSPSRWRDSAHGNQKRLMTLPVEEFLRRFLLHLLHARLSAGGQGSDFWLTQRRAEFLPLCFRLLQPSDQPAADATSSALPIPSLWQCPLCGGTMQVVERLSAPRNSSSDLRLISAGAPHESTSPASNLARASARTMVLCSRIPQNAVCLCAPDLSPCTTPRHYSANRY